MLLKLILLDLSGNRSIFYSWGHSILKHILISVILKSLNVVCIPWSEWQYESTGLIKAHTYFNMGAWQALILFIRSKLKCYSTNMTRLILLGLNGNMSKLYHFSQASFRHVLIWVLEKHSYSFLDQNLCVAQTIRWE